MRFLIFNIVVAGALAFLVMDRPNLELANAPIGDMTIPEAPMTDPVTETPVALQPPQHAPVKAEPEKPEPKPIAEVPPMPPAQEVQVRVTHKAPRDVSPGLTEAAERIKAEINERQTQPFNGVPVETEPTQTAAVEVPDYDQAVSRRKALMDLVSDMELMFAEKMMR